MTITALANRNHIVTSSLNIIIDSFYKNAIRGPFWIYKKSLIYSGVFVS